VASRPKFWPRSRSQSSCLGLGLTHLASAWRRSEADEENFFGLVRLNRDEFFLNWLHLTPGVIPLSCISILVAALHDLRFSVRG